MYSGWGPRGWGWDQVCTFLGLSPCPASTIPGLSSLQCYIMLIITNSSCNISSSPGWEYALITSWKIEKYSSLTQQYNPNSGCTLINFNTIWEKTCHNRHSNSKSKHILKRCVSARHGSIYSLINIPMINFVHIYIDVPLPISWYVWLLYQVLLVKFNSPSSWDEILSWYWKVLWSCYSSAACKSYFTHHSRW